MFTVHYRGFPVECDTALEVVALVTVIETPTKEAKTTPRTAKATTTTRKQTRTAPSRTEKDKRNAKARAAYLSKHPKEETTTTTSRLQALPSKPTSIHPGRGKGSRAKTSSAVIATLKRSPSPLTLEEIDTDLEKSGWPYKGQDRKGAIRATLARLKANGTVSAGKRVTELGTIHLFRLERTNGDTPTPVEQVLNGREDSEQMAADVERAEAEGDPDAREF